MRIINAQSAPSTLESEAAAALAGWLARHHKQLVAVGHQAAADLAGKAVAALDRADDDPATTTGELTHANPIL